MAIGEENDGKYVISVMLRSHHFQYVLDANRLSFIEHVRTGLKVTRKTFISEILFFVHFSTRQKFKCEKNQKQFNAYDKFVFVCFFVCRLPHHSRIPEATRCCCCWLPPFFVCFFSSLQNRSIFTFGHLFMLHCYYYYYFILVAQPKKIEGPRNHPEKITSNAIT